MEFDDKVKLRGAASLSPLLATVLTGSAARSSHRYGSRHPDAPGSSVSG